MPLPTALATWRRLEGALASYLYRLGRFTATRPVLILYACIVAIVALSYPAAVYIDFAINGPAGYEPLRFWQPAQRVDLGATAAAAVAPGLAHDTPSGYLRIEQVLLTLPKHPPPPPGGSNGEGDGLPRHGTDAAAYDAYAHGVLERHLLVRLGRLEAAVAAFRASDNTTWADLCVRPAGAGRCLVISPLDYWNHSDAAIRLDDDVRATLSHPRTAWTGLPLSVWSVFGGLVLDDVGGHITYASSMVVTYFAAIHDDRDRGRADRFWHELWLSDNVQALAPLMTIDRRDGGIDVDDDHRRHHFIYKPATVAAAASATAPAAQQQASAELWLLGLAYVIMFIYISLSLGRVELVKSKFGLGLSAVATVIFSLTMSVGVCSRLGIALTLVPWCVRSEGHVVEPPWANADCGSDRLGKVRGNAGKCCRFCSCSSASRTPLRSRMRSRPPPSICPSRSASPSVRLWAMTSKIPSALRPRSRCWPSRWTLSVSRFGYGGPRDGAHPGHRAAPAGCGRGHGHRGV